MRCLESTCKGSMLGKGTVEEKMFPSLWIATPATNSIGKDSSLLQIISCSFSSSIPSGGVLLAYVVSVKSKPRGLDRGV
ncbi:unnamed protein product [Brassica oleracea var. botrytis]|uniref:Uncharacterized protein n=1 Tax=Brassica oleracea TaxID=3712 RepID=A0A3P6BIK5_BRAOL|nr:unnamed protein product [Brassica oleracea]